MSFVNPFTRKGQWHKANFHTHTTTSDGHVPVAGRIAQYAKAGYSILAITDHYKTNDLSGLSSKELLLVSGMEYHPQCPSSPEVHHLVALNVPFGFAFSQEHPDDANACIQAVRQAGGESILAHPFWCGHRYDMFNYLKDFIAVEVYNSTCDAVGRAESNESWSQLLDAGRYVPALAVDDAHRDDDALRGWTMLRTGRLNAGSVMDALRAGCFYSSTGPEVHDFAVRRGHVEVECSDAVSIHIMAQNSNGAGARADHGKAIRSFRCPVRNFWQYVRVVVVDKHGHKAWTNPIVLK